MSGSSHDASFGRLAARRLAATAGPALVCPDAETWAAYVDGGLGTDEEEGLERHLVSCADCRHLVAALSPAEDAVPVAGDHAEPRRLLPFRRALMTRWLPLAATLVGGTVLWYVAAPRQAPPEGSMARHEVTTAAEPAMKSAPAAPPAELPARDAVATMPVPPVEADRLRSAASRRARALAAATAQTGAPPGAATEAPSVDTVRTGLGEDETAAEERQKLLARVAEQESRSRRDAASADADRPAEAAAPPAAAPAPAAPARQVAAGAVGGARAGNALPASPPPADGTAASARAERRVPAFAAPHDASAPAFASVVFGEPDGRLRWRIVDGRRIESSSDGGTTWSPRFTESSARLSAGSAPAIEAAWVVGTRGTVLRLAVPGGWTRVTRPTEHALVSVVGIDALRARVTDANGATYETLDGGATWQTVGAP